MTKIQKKKEKATEKANTLVQNYGLYWDKDLVYWGGPKKQGTLLGVKFENGTTKGKSPVDFRNQIGIYILYDINKRIVYVGQAGAGQHNALFDRLKQHKKDHLRNKWQFFSWFGFYRVNKDTSLKSAEIKLINIKTALNDFEGILIKTIEPSLNKQDANFSKCTEYEQYYKDEVIEQNEEDDPIMQEIKTLSEKIEKLSSIINKKK